MSKEKKVDHDLLEAAKALEGADLQQLPISLLEGLFKRLLDSLPPDQVAALLVPFIAPTVKKSPMAVAIIKALAEELS
jgi:hypothetical protein